ncbi:cytochrome P450 [Kineococcus sp. LSe6-4]|uniref:Cytochrome P450 n=1 Tax=Kineococcus halophytocola TaxID=3234027 RepID=A0ABV4H0R3_9ACTN
MSSALTDLAVLPTSDADPFSLENLTDPLPLHAALRDAGPVVHLSRYDAYAMARYDEVHDSLRNWQDFESSSGVGLPNFRHEKPWWTPSVLLEADPPRHDAPYRVLKDILSPRALRRLRERWAADADGIVNALVAGAGSGTVDLDAVPDLAEAFPLRVFPDEVGIPSEGRENLLPYGDHQFNALGPPGELKDRHAARAQELLAWVMAQTSRDVLSADGFGAQVWAAADRGEILPEHAPMLVRALLSAGLDTTISGIAAVLNAFALHPDQWQRLRAEPELIRVAFDEAVRWESPVQTFFRVATRDVSAGAAVVPEGHKILMFLGSANRDPRRWSTPEHPDPDAFDLTRDPSGHVGFGMGVHHCVGQHVARLEAQSLLTALLPRVERIELTGEPRRHLNNTLRMWESLPLRLHLA